MRTLIEVVVQLAAQRLDGLWVRAAASENRVLSWNDITWSQLAIAVDYGAHWMEARLEFPAENETVAYMGTRYKTPLTLPRNCQDAQNALPGSTQCKKFVHTREFSAQMQALATHHSSLELIDIPCLDDILQPEPAASPYYNLLRAREDDIALILHSSGSTRLPKPIFIRTGAPAAVDIITSMPAPSDRKNIHNDLFAPTLMASMMPFFHIMGIPTLTRSIYHQGPLALLPPGQPVTADLLMTAIVQTKPSAAAFAPSVLEKACSLFNGLETLSTLDYVFYGGAPLARSCVNQIARVTNLQVCIGSMEILNAPNYLTRDSEDWEYFESSAEAGISMEPATDRSSEMGIKHKLDRRHQIIFHNFPELSEWRTKATSQPVCPPQFIYNNPTINELSRAIQQKITGNGDGLAEKVEFLAADFTQEQFGLSSGKYQELQKNINVFLHNAWPVNASFESFESTAIIGRRRCINFALSATHCSHIMFPSSIASVGSWHADVCIPLKQGYGESKHVASSILFQAARKSGLKATVVRLGQLGGSVDGAGVWNKTGRYY
ncbi:hypothetical protein F1880_004567 [Penicillium rolfsii]|nr:hypothetical protein F1880_004567 [Penicillium rolfsii]